jgi:pyruvate-ferredoxin/flavodoxin oxidoreductase
LSGSVQNQDAYMQATAGQRPISSTTSRPWPTAAWTNTPALTGRRYQRVSTFKAEDADYLILGMGSMIVQAEAVADYLRETRKLKVGVVNLTMFRPFPGDLLGHVLRGKKGVAVLERTDQPLAEDLPLMREVRATRDEVRGERHGGGAGAEGCALSRLRGYAAADMPRLYSGCYGLGSRDLQPEALIGAVENMLPEGAQRKFFYLSIDFARDPLNPKDEVHQQDIADKYPRSARWACAARRTPTCCPRARSPCACTRSAAGARSPPARTWR